MAKINVKQNPVNVNSRERVTPHDDLLNYLQFAVSDLGGRVTAARVHKYFVSEDRERRSLTTVGDVDGWLSEIVAAGELYKDGEYYVSDFQPIAARPS